MGYSDTHSHNVSDMEQWNQKLKDNADNYDALVDEFYTIVRGFVGTSDFRGGLAEQLESNVLSYEGEFRRYSDTFAECKKFMDNKITEIEDTTNTLASGIDANNPMQ